MTKALLTALLIPLVFQADSGVDVQSVDSLPMAQHDYPTPNEPDMLFYIQRSVNENAIVYALKRDSKGRVVKGRPLDVYWKRYQEDGSRAELDFIQRTFAYGIRTKDKGDHYELRCVAYDAKPLVLYKSSIAANDPRVYAETSEGMMTLTRIFVQIEGGTFWLPNVKYVELHGTNENGKVVVERIVP